MIKGKSWMAIVIALMLLTVHLTSSAQTVHAAAGEETKIAATLFVLKNESEVSNAKIHWAPVQERLHTSYTDQRTMRLIRYYRP